MAGSTTNKWVYLVIDGQEVKLLKRRPNGFPERVGRIVLPIKLVFPREMRPEIVIEVPMPEASVELFEEQT